MMKLQKYFNAICTYKCRIGYGKENKAGQDIKCRQAIARLYNDEPACFSPFIDDNL